VLAFLRMYVIGFVVRGGAVVVALRYNQEGRGIDSRLCHWNFSLTSGRTMALGSTQPVTEMSTRNFHG
jgi:hypothetical protein